LKEAGQSENEEFYRFIPYHAFAKESSSPLIKMDHLLFINIDLIKK
jgi:hypothetical protein